MQRRAFAMIGLCAGFLAEGIAGEEGVSLIALPGGGIQPRAKTGSDGAERIVFFQGEPTGGDLFHFVRQAGTSSNDQIPRKVNSIPDSAVATGTIRGAQIALGKRDRIHVVWNGSFRKQGDRPPLYYARSSADGVEFEPQRPVSEDWIMDGGAAVVADPKGAVHVFFHGGDGGTESDRRVFLRSSQDEGATFQAERPISPEGSGVCACCGMQAHIDERGRIYVIYRTSSEEGKNRSIATLFSDDGGASWKHDIVDPWKIDMCPMSSMSIVSVGGNVIMAWEREGQIYLGRWDKNSERITDIQALPGSPALRKHPSLAGNSSGDLLVAWTEGTGWNRGGTLAWQRFDSQGNPAGAPGKAPNLPVWSFLAVIPRGQGFEILH